LSALREAELAPTSVVSSQRRGSGAGTPPASRQAAGKAPVFFILRDEICRSRARLERDGALGGQQISRDTCKPLHDCTASSTPQQHIGYTDHLIDASAWRAKSGRPRAESSAENLSAAGKAEARHGFTFRFGGSRKRDVTAGRPRLIRERHHNDAVRIINSRIPCYVRMPR